MKPCSISHTWQTATTLRDVYMGDLVTVGTWCDARYVEHTVRVLSNQVLRTTWSTNVHHGTNAAECWLPIRIVFGVLAYDHAPLSASEPLWLIHPQDSLDATPAAIIWSDQEHICVILGRPGQHAGAFREQVFAALPRPLRLEERLQLMTTPFRVLIVARWSEKRVNFRKWLEYHGFVVDPTSYTVDWTEIVNHCNTYTVVVASDRLRDFSPPVLRTYEERTIKLEIGDVNVFRRSDTGKVTVLDGRNAGKEGFLHALLNSAGIEMTSVTQ